MTAICPKCRHENPEGTVFCGKCGTPLPPQESTITKTMGTPKEELTTGSLFAKRYQIIEELGKGGMGRVYRAVDKKLNEEVAIKLIKPEIASDKKTIQRFSNEVKLARKIAHKNIGRMYELMDDKGTHFITMEYVPGEDLKSFIRRAAQLGVILYEMVTGQVPFEGDTPFTIGIKHKSEIPKDPKELNTQMPDELSWVILKCLEKDKEKRYQSAVELCSELNRIEQGLPTTERKAKDRKFVFLLLMIFPPIHQISAL